MELAKRTEPVDPPQPLRASPVARWETKDDSLLGDQDVARAWELKAQLCWSRNDHGPLNRFRWFIWGRYGAGRPPSRVEQKSMRRGHTDTSSIAPFLHLVTPEGGAAGGIQSLDRDARVGA
jgi:hypothetical protein